MTISKFFHVKPNGNGKVFTRMCLAFHNMQKPAGPVPRTQLNQLSINEKSARYQFQQHFTIRAAFLYKSILCSFSLLHFGYVFFLAKKYRHKSHSHNICEIDYKFWLMLCKYFKAQNGPTACRKFQIDPIQQLFSTAGARPGTGT